MKTGAWQTPTGGLNWRITKKGIPYVEKIPGSANWQYKRDVPPDLQAAIGKKRWTKSRKTADLRELARQARMLAAQHRPNSTNAKQLNLTPEERETIDDAGGVDDYLQDLDEPATEVAGLKTAVEHMREWAACESRGVPQSAWQDPARAGEDTPDPEWARSEIAALEAKAHAIHDQLARELTLVDKVKPLHPTPAGGSAASEALPAVMSRPGATLGGDPGGLRKARQEARRRESVRGARQGI